MAFLLLVRHGQNEWVKKKRLAGWVPGVHLNDEGQEQARLLAQRLSSLPINSIYSSPLERCIETAEILAKPHGLEIIELEEVGEVRYGEWEGKKLKKLARKKRKWHAVQHYPSRFRFPNGESFIEVQDRAVQALEVLSQRHEKEITAVVSHADVIRLVLAHFLGMHIDLFQRLVIAPTSVSIVALNKSGPVRVLRINDNGRFKIPQEPNQKPDHHSDNELTSTLKSADDYPDEHLNEDTHEDPPHMGE